MSKKILIIIIVIMWCLDVSSSNLLAAPDKLLPEELVGLKTDMSIVEYKTIFPHAKAVVKDSSLALYSIDIKKNNFWNTVACIFEKDALIFFALTMIDTGENIINNKSLMFNNIDTEVCNLIKIIVQNFGKIRQKKIIENMDEKIYYEPLMIWENDTIVVQLNYTPSKTAHNVKSPIFSIAFSKKGIDYSRFYRKIIHEDNETISFDSLLSDDIKKLLCNEVPK